MSLKVASARITIRKMNSEKIDPSMGTSESKIASCDDVYMDAQEEDVIMEKEDEEKKQARERVALIQPRPNSFLGWNDREGFKPDDYYKMRPQPDPLDDVLFHQPGVRNTPHNDDQLSVIHRLPISRELKLRIINDMARTDLRENKPMTLRSGKEIFTEDEKPVFKYKQKKKKRRGKSQQG